MADKTVTNLVSAIQHEEEAVSNYLQWCAEADEPHIEEMFRQFAKNESWHLAALQEKLQQLGEEKTE